METSLRYGVDSKALKIHAKERFAIDSSTHLQVTRVDFLILFMGIP
jgi:hypothetical protein